MTITKDHIGGLIFLCLSVAYGYYARQIPLLPGDEYEPFTAQSLPKALAMFGTLFSVALLATASRSPEDKLVLTGHNFALVLKLLVVVVLFAIALEWLGFFVSTLLFLISGFFILGERNWKTILLASFPFSLGIWFVLAKLLDIYLAPGQLFTSIIGS